MHIEDKGYTERIEWVQWFFALGLGGLFTHLAYIAIWDQAITLGPHRTMTGGQSEGIYATITGFLLLTVACIFFCALFYKLPRITRLKRCLISGVGFAAFGIALCLLRPSLGAL